MRTPLTRDLGLDVPVFAFTYQPEVAVEVSRNGGLGVLGAVRFSPDELADAIAYVEREVGDRPYGVDLVMPASTEAVPEGMTGDELVAALESMIPQEHRDFVQAVLDEHGVPPLPDGELPPRGLLGWTDATSRPQLEVALAHRPALLANALDRKSVV